MYLAIPHTRGLTHADHSKLVLLSFLLLIWHMHVVLLHILILRSEMKLMQKPKQLAKSWQVAISWHAEYINMIYGH